MHTRRTIMSQLMVALLAILLVCMRVGSIQAQYNNAYATYGGLVPDSTTIFLDSAKVVAETSPAQSLTLLNRALEAAILNRNKNGEARAYLVMGKLQKQLGHAAEAQESWLKCKSLFGQATLGGVATNSTNTATYSNSTYGAVQTQPSISGLDQSILLEATAALTRAYEDANQLDAAYTESESWQQLLPVTPTKAKQNEVLRIQARLRSKLGKNQDATRRFLQLLEAEQQANDPSGTCETLIELGEHYQRHGDNTKAKVEFEKAIALAQQYQYKDKNIRATHALAAIYHAEGNLQKELDLRNGVVSLTGSTNDIQNNYLQNIAIGNAYLQANQPALAEQYVQHGVEKMTALIPQTWITTNGGTPALSSLPNSAELQVGADAYRLLAEGYLKKSALEKSLEYYKKYAVLQDSVKAVQARELADAVSLSKDFGKNEERVQLLERERALSDASIDLLRQDQAIKGNQILTRNLIIGVLAAFLMLGIVAAFILVRNTRARRRADKLLALQSMTGQMNPHFIFNALNSVNEYISQNDERAANRYLTAFSRLMRKVMDDSKHTFIPLTEEIDMLKLYLELEHARFKDQFSYRFEVDETLENADFELPPMIVQPYIENAIWHGLRYRPGGGQLLIHFAQVDGRLVITIADDGIGIALSKAIKTPQQKRQQSMGLKNIGTRMALMNEIYALGMEVQLTETHAGAEHPGTSVRIVIPQNRLSTPAFTPPAQKPTA